MNSALTSKEGIIYFNLAHVFIADDETWKVLCAIIAEIKFNCRKITSKR